MPRQPDEEPAVESEEDDEIEDEEGPVGPEDPEFKYVERRLRRETTNANHIVHRFPGELEPPYMTTYPAQSLYGIIPPMQNRVSFC